MKWADLERAGLKAAGVTLDGRNLTAIHSRHVVWAENREQSGLSVRTLQDRQKYWKRLEPVFETVPIDDFKPGYVIRYFDSRPRKYRPRKK